MTTDCLTTNEAQFNYNSSPDPRKAPTHTQLAQDGVGIWNERRLTTSTWTLGVGRCFPFWQEVMGCYVVNTSAADDSGKKKCGLVLEDYYECLHHKKEHARALAMQAAYARSESATARDDAPSVKQIRSLGLIDKEEDTKKVLGRS
ncbi:unnamed protein product [Fusarium venenatum]|uniref:NADH dehydrogenase [ubiquinone] iron-sulfur protein 5 n=1 Tax=Fusarium venenatum TaxID=56646 RepID=A0A2L2TVW0_9HYPO|nr:uncharacterized protein FVRRES_02262 [Fusarium venenatum]CEI65750.1 unnamed protein product [Fusarium venenatum]